MGSKCSKCGHDLANGSATCAACGGPTTGAGFPSAEFQKHFEPPFACEKLSPEMLEWLREGFNEEEFLAEVREVLETGGLELKDFIHELEQEAASGD